MANEDKPIICSIHVWEPFLGHDGILPIKDYTRYFRICVMCGIIKELDKKDE